VVVPTGCCAHNRGVLRRAMLVNWVGARHRRGRTGAAAVSVRGQVRWNSRVRVGLARVVGVRLDRGDAERHPRARSVVEFASPSLTIARLGPGADLVAWLLLAGQGTPSDYPSPICLVSPGGRLGSLCKSRMCLSPASRGKRCRRGSALPCKAVQAVPLA